MVGIIIAKKNECASFLIEQGADINLTDKALGYTALSWAAYLGNIDIVKLLLEKNAKIDLTENMFQQTPLLIATQAGYSEIVDILLRSGANIHAQTSDYCNALSIAEAHQYLAIVNQLKKYGARLPAMPLCIHVEWPVIADSPFMANDTNPISVLRGFILAMSTWESRCEKDHQQNNNEQLDWAFIVEEQEKIFSRFCTIKKRPYGRNGSFSSPPEYTPNETLLSVNICRHQAKAITQQEKSTFMCQEFEYSLILKNNTWRIDNKKRRHLGSKEWQTTIL